MYAYDDWALSVVAAAAGETDVRDAFVNRSKNYRCNERENAAEHNNISLQTCVGQANRVHVPPCKQRRLRVQLRPFNAVHSGQALHRGQRVAVDVVGGLNTNTSVHGREFIFHHCFCSVTCRFLVTPLVLSVCFRRRSVSVNACTCSCCVARCTPGFLSPIF